MRVSRLAREGWTCSQLASSPPTTRTRARLRVSPWALCLVVASARSRVRRSGLPPPQLLDVNGLAGPTSGFGCHGPPPGPSSLYRKGSPQRRAAGAPDTVRPASGGRARRSPATAVAGRKTPRRSADETASRPGGASSSTPARPVSQLNSLTGNRGSQLGRALQPIVPLTQPPHDTARRGQQGSVRCLPGGLEQSIYGGNHGSRDCVGLHHLDRPSSPQVVRGRDGHQHKGKPPVVGVGAVGAQQVHAAVGPAG